MATANVSTTSPGSTPFVVDVTACNLLTDLTVKDFQVFVGGTLNCSGASCTSWSKTTATQLTYSGVVIANGTTIQVRRKTPNNVVEPIVFASRFSSALWNSELDRMIRWREEADLNAVGPGSAVTLATPIDTAYPTGWDGNVINPPTLNTIYDALQLFAPLVSPTFTGVPAAPTAADATSTTQLATTAYAVTRVANALSSSPALGGNPTTTTQTAGNNSTRVATTAFVATEIQGIFDGTSAYAPSINNRGFKNLSINGTFEIWQAGTSFGIAAGGALQTSYSADMFQMQSDPSGGTSIAFTVNRGTHTVGQTAVPGNPKYFYSIASSTGGASLGANSYHLIAHPIEDVAVTQGQSLTISFWAKVNSGTKVIGLELAQVFGAGGSPSATVTGIGGQQFTITTTWTKYTATITVPSISGKTIGTTENTSYTLVNFWLQAGSTIGAARCGGAISWAVSTIDISQLQIERGSLATPIELRPISLELEMCQRYYEETRTFLEGTVSGANSTSATAFYKTKRIAPSGVVSINNSGNMNGSPVHTTISSSSARISWTTTAAGAFFWDVTDKISARF